MRMLIFFSLTLIKVLIAQVPSMLQFPAPRHINYTSLVYCPLDSTNTKELFYQQFTFDTFPAQKANTKSNHRKLTIEDDDRQKYLIVVKWSAEQKILDHFMFCGFTRNWLQKDCSQAQIRCNTPGPTFYLQRDKAVDVAWIYDVKGPQFLSTQYKYLKVCCYFLKNNETYNLELPYCHDAFYTHVRCDNHYKNVDNQKCTYLDPITLLGAPYQDFRANMSSVPITMHVHGLQARPTFDGNPENQMAGNGHFGVGYQTLANADYYKQFTDFTPTSFHFTLKESQFIKIDRYQNFQGPGTLLYHDHSNHVTYTNNVLGLYGLYIIHDQIDEKDLPSAEHQVHLIFTPTFVNDYGLTFQNNNIFSYHNVDVYDSKTLLFKRNQTYRIRLLNAVYQSSSSHLSFFTQCDIDINSDHFDYKTCKKQLLFSVIGTDSVLFDKPIHNVKEFSLFSSERIDILIIFDGDNGFKTQNEIAPDEQYIWLITQGNYTRSFVHIRMEIQPKVHHANKNLLPQDVYQIGDLDFYDLRQITEPCKYGFDSAPETSSTCILKTRYKGLMRDTTPNFAINARYEYMNMGTADYVQVGTTEDWYFINLLLSQDEPHSLHFHLVNTQIIQRGQVKKIPGNIQDPSNDNVFPAECSYYEVQFYINAQVIVQDKNNFLKVCQQIRQKAFIQIDIGQHYKQNVFDENNSTGFPLTTLMSQQDFTSGRYYSPSCPESRYKYICNGSLPIEPYLQRWKDSAPLVFHEFIRIRIRFASAEYDPKKSAYPFFNVPEDQLLQFPHYVYHCHYLRHEDLSQMRPLIMTPSPFYAKSFPPPKGSQLQKCMKANNLTNQGGWESRYNCLNKVVGCSNETSQQSWLLGSSSSDNKKSGVLDDKKKK